MGCSKKEFEHAARLIRESAPEHKDRFCGIFEDVFLKSNPRFDTKRFRKAAGCRE